MDQTYSSSINSITVSFLMTGPSAYLILAIQEKPPPTMMASHVMLGLMFSLIDELEHSGLGEHVDGVRRRNEPVHSPRMTDDSKRPSRMLALASLSITQTFGHG